MDNENKYDKYDVMTPDGNFLCRLNQKLISDRKISDETLNRIKTLHILKWYIFQQIEFCGDDGQWDIVRSLAKSLEEVEFSLQRLWGFPENANYHRWWEIPHCTCAKIDNEDRYGSKYRIVHMNCPIHGIER